MIIILYVSNGLVVVIGKQDRGNPVWTANLCICETINIRKTLELNTNRKHFETKVRERKEKTSRHSFSQFFLLT